MSTKTSIKRIALVAVSALGFGLLSVSSANAADAAANEVASIALSQAAGTPTVGTPVPLVTATVNFSANKAEDDDVVNLVALLVDQPAGSNLSIDATVATNAAGATLLIDTTGVTDGVVSTATAAVNNVGGLDNTTAAQKFATFTFTPTAAGNHTLRVFHDANADGLYTVGEVSSTIAVSVSTVVAAATEASIKGTATAVTASAVSLTTVEPSNRVGVPVITTPKASFTNTTAADTAASSHKATVIYNLAKPVGSAATLNITTEAITSPALDGTDAGGNGSTTGETASGTGTNLTFTPDVAGTYTISMWHESVADGAITTAEATTTKSFVIGADELKMTVSTYGSLVKGADDAGGLLVKIALTGADGKAASLAANESITVTRTAGTANIDFVTYDGTFGNYGGNYDPAATATYTFNAAQFNSSGVAAFIVNDNTAEGLSTWTVVGSGGKAAALSHSMTTTASKTATAADNASIVTIENVTGVAGDVSAASGTTSDVANIAYGKATSVSFKSSAITAGSLVPYTITDTSGNMTGIPGAKYRGAVSGATTTATTATAVVSFTLTLDAAAALASAAFAFDTTTAGPTGFVITAAYPVVASVTNPDLQIRSVTADTNTIRVLVKDQFGIAFPTASVTPTVTGRNATVGAQPTLWTNANGYAYYTLKDVSTSTTSLTDTVKFTSSAVQSSGGAGIDSTANTVITYVSSLNVGTVTLTTPNSAEETAGTALTPNDINAGSGGAEDGAFEVSALVKDANGSILTGVKVTWTITGEGSAVTSTTVSGYTDATGKATAKVYAWLAGDKSVTATVGGVSKAGKLAFAQNTPEEARTATISSAGRVVTVVAKDRFGNVVKAVPFTATINGDGFFGTGTNVVSNAQTDATGTVKFLVLQNAVDIDVKVEFGASAGLTTPYGQSGDAAGAFDTIGTAADAPVAGTNEKDETYVGNVAAYLEKGTGAMSATVKADTTQIDAVNAAADAAAEAIDAANAATDAANLAAEAADAATVAAEEARDAADAATAAVEELATQVATLMAALKAQITTLANTVAKIAKKVKA